MALARVGLFAGAPASALPALAAVAAAGDGKASRLAHALLTVALGPGEGGTPHPGGAGGGRVAAETPAAALAPLWAAAGDPGAQAGAVDSALRLLAAAARAGDGRWDADLVAAVGAALARGEADAAKAVAPRKASKKAPSSTSYDVLGSALVAARCALRGRALKDAASRALPAAGAPDALVARHALGLIAAFARADPGKASEALGSGLSEAAAMALAAYEASPHVLGARPASAKSPNHGTTPGLNLADPWARCYAARAAAGLLFGGAGRASFGDASSSPLRSLLTALATRDADDMVALDAARCLAGALPAAAANEPRDGVRAGRAWAALEARAGEAAVFIPGLQADDAGTLLGAVACRVRGALRARSPALVCAGARTAAALAEAWARGGDRQGGRSPAGAVVAALVGDLGAVVAGGTGAEAGAAMDALLWLAAAEPGIVVAPEDAFDLASSRPGWSEGLAAAAASTARRAVRARPASAASTLAVLTALVAGAPSKAPPTTLVDTWAASASAAAARSAHAVLAAPRPPTDDPADDAAWSGHQRLAAWWLGEHGNVAAGQVAGANGDGADADAATSLPLGDAVVAALSASPLLTDVTASLTHAALTTPWPTRVAAVLALAKVAARSPPPWRQSAYAALAPHAAPPHASRPDALGVSAIVRPVLAAIDAVESAGAAVAARARGAWNEAALAALRDVHDASCARLQTLTGPLPDGCYPLGMRGERGEDGRSDEAPPPHKPSSSPSRPALPRPARVGRPAVAACSRRRRPLHRGPWRPRARTRQAGSLTRRRGRSRVGCRLLR